ncbi:hypothetical protein ES703_116797 [subsurface metagenome]
METRPTNSQLNKDMAFGQRVKKRPWGIDAEWALSMQAIAIAQFYIKIWPGVEIIELDRGMKGTLATIIDIGGQDTKVIRINEAGNVVSFAMNDKCAAGTGRFLEVMARALELEISEIGPMSLKGNNPCQISSTCTVFAETEVVALLTKGNSREDLLGGIHKAVTSRVMSMVRMMGYEKQVVLTGGVAKNVGIKKFLEDEMKMEVMTPKEPQITGALGAALVAELASVS